MGVCFVAFARTGLLVPPCTIFKENKGLAGDFRRSCSVFVSSRSSVTVVCYIFLVLRRAAHGETYSVSAEAPGSTVGHR